MVSTYATIILKYVSLLKMELAPELLIKLKLLKESNLSVYISGALQVRVCLSEYSIPLQ